MVCACITVSVHIPGDMQYASLFSAAATAVGCLIETCQDAVHNLYYACMFGGSCLYIVRDVLYV